MSTVLSDVLIIGGGPAGLSAATSLARQLYKVVVFDSGVYRNARAPYMHNVLGWDHQPPAEFRAKGRKDLLARYSTVKFEDIHIDSIEKTTQGIFKATDANGKAWFGRKLMLATGVRDIYPDIEGYGDCWAKGIFHCLFCHGYEERGVSSAGVLAIGFVGNAGVAMHMARMAKRLAGKVTIYSDDAQELTSQLQTAADGTGIHIDSRPISGLAKGSKGTDVIIKFGSGTESKVEGFLVHAPKTEINGGFAQQLGLELTEQGDIKTTQPFYESSMSGVFAVGDCATFMKAVVQAVAMGAFAAGGVVAQLGAEPAVELNPL